MSPLYADGSANTIRPTEITYPNGRQIDYNYGTSDGMDDVLSRLQPIKESTTQLAAYTYLGAGMVVQVDYTEPNIRYDLITGSGDDPYDGLDRFDRVIDCLWRDYGSWKCCPRSSCDLGFSALRREPSRSRSFGIDASTGRQSLTTSSVSKSVLRSLAMDTA